MKGRRLYGMLVIVFFGLFVLVALLMVYAAGMTRNNYSVQGEPKNAYLVHMFDRGIYREQYMCANTSGQDCVLLRTPGMHNFIVPSIEIDGEVFVDAIPSFVYTQFATGLYCPGAIEMMSCFEVVTLKIGASCPESIKHLGFTAPLVPNSCLTKKK